MKVYSGKSFLKQTIWHSCFLLLISILVLCASFLPATHAISYQKDANQNNDSQKERDSKEANDRLDRDAKKLIRLGKYEDALKIYLGMIEANTRDSRSRLGASFAYLKMQNYPPCFQQAKEVLSIDAHNARAHALAGVSLLRSGFIRAAIGELTQALELDPKEALA